MVLYRSPELFITDRLFVVRRGPRARYAVAELKNVHVVCAEIRRGGRAVGRYVGALAMLLIIIAVLLDSPVALALALLALGGAAAVGSLASRTHRRTWELRARHRNAEICLFASSDEIKFGQVKRAMVRAIEASERP